MAVMMVVNSHWSYVTVGVAKVRLMSNTTPRLG